MGIEYVYRCGAREHRWKLGEKDRDEMYALAAVLPDAVRLLQVAVIGRAEVCARTELAAAADAVLARLDKGGALVRDYEFRIEGDLAPGITAEWGAGTLSGVRLADHPGRQFTLDVGYDRCVLRGSGGDDAVNLDCRGVESVGGTQFGTIWFRSKAASAVEGPLGRLAEFLRGCSAEQVAKIAEIRHAEDHSTKLRPKGLEGISTVVEAGVGEEHATGLWKRLFGAAPPAAGMRSGAIENAGIVISPKGAMALIKGADALIATRDFDAFLLLPLEQSSDERQLKKFLESSEAAHWAFFDLSYQWCVVVAGEGRLVCVEA